MWYMVYDSSVESRARARNRCWILFNPLITDIVVYRPVRPDGSWYTASDADGNAGERSEVASVPSFSLLHFTVEPV